MPGSVVEWDIELTVFCYAKRSGLVIVYILIVDWTIPVSDLKWMRKALKFSLEQCYQLEQ